MKKKLSLLRMAILILAMCAVGFTACSNQHATLSAIAVKEGSLQTDYTVGEALNLNGAQITATMSDGSSREENITSEMVSGFSTESSGSRTMLITYQGMMTAVNYTVVAPAVPTASSIELKSGALRRIYVLGSDLDLTDAKLTVRHSDGTSGEVAITADMVAGFDSSKPGEGVLYISYQGKLCVFDYTIIEEVVTLDIPVLTLNGSVMTWDKQDMADGYEVYLNNQLVDTVDDRFYNIPVSEIGIYHYTVKAKGNGVSVLDSAIAEPAVYNVSGETISSVKVDEAGFSWQACIGATGYTVRIGDEERFVSETRYPMTFRENTTYVVKIKVHYGKDESDYSRDLAFHALKTPGNLTIESQTAQKQFVFSWERENSSIDTGYTLYYRSGENVVPLASGITEKSYKVSFSSFKDKNIDGVFVAATDSRADCIAIGRSNEVELHEQIRTVARPSHFSADDDVINWDMVDGAGFSVTVNGSTIESSYGQFDTSDLEGGKSYTLSVKSLATSEYDFDSPFSTFSFYKHAAPTQLSLKGSVVSFEGNGKALLYDVTFQGETYVTSGDSIDLSEQTKNLAAGRYTISVRAITSGLIENEVSSDATKIVLTVYSMNFSYNGTTLSWQPVTGATGYRVSVDGGEPTDHGSSTSVTIPAGTSNVEVIPYNDYGDVLVDNNIAELVTLTYDVNGGSPELAPVSYLKGDAIGDLPHVIKYNTISGEWYDSDDPSTRKPVTADTVITQDLTIYADYDIVQYDTSGTTARVTGLRYTPSDAFSVVIPEEKNGKAVTEIASSAFFNKNTLMSITIPDSVTSIGESAFYGCSGLTSITIPDSVTSIGSNVFSGCSGLTSITIPDRVTSIGERAFSGCSGLTSITIPDRVTSIGESAFSGCSGLTSVTIPNSVTSIGDFAFSGCSGLIIYAVASEKPSGWDVSWNNDQRPVVWDCINNEIADDGYIYTMQGGIQYGLKDGAATVAEVPETITTAAISKTITYKGTVYNVTSIANRAFEGCTGLTSITIPDSVTSIGGGVFSDCSGLTSITIPFVGAMKDGTENTKFRYIFDSVPASLKSVIITGGKSIQDSAFSGCSGLTSITIPDSVTSIGSSAFSDCSGLTSITIPDSVTSIGFSAFSDCSGLTSITIPDSVTSIGDNAFMGCSGLTSVTIGNGVTSISEYAFQNCGGLTSITIPDSVTSIGKSAFFGCSGLTSITIPASVTSIGYGAFLDCSGLTSLTVDSKNAEYHSAGNCIIETSTKTLLFGCKSSVIPVDGSVISIGGGAFSGCSGLTSITIPDSVTSIGGSAFFGCSGLTSITIPDSVTSIGDSAFYNCDGLTSVTIPDSVMNIGGWAFSDCSGLTSVTIGNGVTSIGNSVFRGCAGLTSITIPDSVTSIEESVFFGCSGLTSITIPDSVTSIRDSAFSGCRRLIIYAVASEKPSGWVVSWNNDQRPVVWDCINNEIAEDGYIYTMQGGIQYGLKDGAATVAGVPETITTATIAKTITYKGTVYNVTSIANRAFEGCTGLTSITIPDSVTSIGESAFSGCSGLTSITIPNSVTSIGGSAFENCSGLTSITIPASVTSIGNNAFSGCRRLIIYAVASEKPSDWLVFWNNDQRPVVWDCINNEIAEDGYIYTMQGGIQYGLKDGAATVAGVPETITTAAIAKTITYKGTVYNVTSIANRAFGRCTGLTSITIPDSVTSIGFSAFYNCDGLTSITIPDSVTSIGDSAFYGCRGLTSITFTGTTAQWQAINKGYSWNSYTGNYTIVCTDGTISKANS